MSDAFVVSARKYRPSTFSSVVGQDHITQTLKKAILSNHLAQAYLFTGPRGIGKTTCARILAKAINCENLQKDGEPCNNCGSCNTFNEQRSFNIFELDAASNNSVDDIRALVDQVRYPPQAGKYKVYIIDEVHMLSTSAFNAFLKTLEEPPPYAVFILATTEKHKIIPTILSRCQINDFNRIQLKDIASHLASIAKKENIKVDDTALHIIAQKADGALRDALTIFDRIASFAKDHVSLEVVIENLNIIDYEYYFKATSFILAKDISNTLLTFDELLNKGFDGQNYLTGLSEHFRNLLICKLKNAVKLLEIPENLEVRYNDQASKTSKSFLLSSLNILNQFGISYRESKNQRLHTEIALLKLCHIQDAINLVSDLQDQKKKSVEPIASKPVTENKPLETKIESKPETEKIFQAHTTNLEKFSAGILSKTQEQDSTTPVNIEVQAVDSYAAIDREKFIVAWKDYLENELADKKKNLYAVMVQNLPEFIDDFTISITFENKALLETFQKERINLAEYLSTKHQIGAFKVEFGLKQLNNEKLSPYLVNPKEKFEYLVTKNPELAYLQQKLDLQPEI